MRRLAYCLLIGCLVSGSAAGAQDRSALLDQARAATDPQAQFELYLRAVEPTDTDTAWASGVYGLALSLLEADQQALAEVWVRWAVRHAPGYALSPIWRPSLRAVRSAVEPTVRADDRPVTTTWRWPSTATPDQAGSVDFTSSDPAAEVSLSVPGIASGGPGEALDLEPGTYDIVVTADGYETIEVQREILPGATTLISADLAPTLSPEVADRVAAGVFSLRPQGTSGQVCVNGLAWGSGTILTSLSALGGAREVEVLVPNGPARGANLLDSDPALDLAVLSVEGTAGNASPSGTPTPSGVGWSIYRPTCAAGVETARTTLPAMGGLASLQLDAVLFPPVTRGSPLIDRSGRVLGLIVDGGRAVSPSQAQSLVDQVFARPEAGGFPTAWVALGGAAVAGGVALLLLGGDQPGSNTGTISIPIPGPGQ